MALRIFVATDSSPNAEFDSRIWYHNLVSPWRDIGCEVIEFKYYLRQTFLLVDPEIPHAKSFIQTNRPRVSEALLQQVKEAHAHKPIDLFFSYFYDACVTPETIDEIKRLQIPTVNWYCNGSYQLHLVSEISPHYDYCLVPEKFRLEDYKKMGANPLYFQEAANPSFYRDLSVQPDTDISFVGQGYGNRPLAMLYLLNQGLTPQIYGSRWTNQDSPELRLLHRGLYSRNTEPRHFFHGIISDDEVVKVFNRSKINLGFNVCGWTHLDDTIRQVRLRDFEVPMTGGFYLAEHMDELGEFFEIGKEVVTYTSWEELADKAHYYLKHETEREQIRRAGQRRALRDHTWQHRFEELLKTLRLKMPSQRRHA